MTQFQIFATLLFICLAGFAYRQELLALLKRIPVLPGNANSAPQSIAVQLVDDLVSVTELRDRLSAEGCVEGVDACTHLLRVIVERTNPAKVVG